MSIASWDSEYGISAKCGIDTAPSGPVRETTVYEVSFPWSELRRISPQAASLPGRGEAWWANFSRVETGEFAGDYTWALTNQYYLHRPNTFGWLVFAGEENPLTPAEGLVLTPKEQVVDKILGGKHFELVKKAYFTGNWMVAENGDTIFTADGDLVRTDDQARSIWRISPKDGLPRRVKYVVAVPGGVYVSGLGLIYISADGNVRKIIKDDGWLLEERASLHQLSDNRILASSGKTLQIIDGVHFSDAIEAGDTVLCAAALPDGKFAVGTPSGFELYSEDGSLLSKTEIAGGIAKAVEHAGMVIGASGKSGLYSIDGSGKCAFYPAPIRIPFQFIYSESATRLWAGYAVGFVVIENGKYYQIHEPLGLAGIAASLAATSASGTTVFSCSIGTPGTYYTTGQNSPFLLVHKEGK